MPQDTKNLEKNEFQKFKIQYVNTTSKQGKNNLKQNRERHHTLNWSELEDKTLQNTA